MKYQYEIPPKLVKKNGFFGTISNYDIGMSVLLAAIGFLAMLIFQNLFGMLLLLICGAVAYLLFIFQDKYGENNRIKIKRRKQYKSKQKRFYFYRQDLFTFSNHQNDMRLYCQKCKIVTKRLIYLLWVFNIITAGLWCTAEFYYAI